MLHSYGVTLITPATIMQHTSRRDFLSNRYPTSIIVELHKNSGYGGQS